LKGIHHVWNAIQYHVWMTITPEGRLDDGVTADGPFNSFDEAKRNAETYVGFTVKDFGKILASA